MTKTRDAGGTDALVPLWFAWRRRQPLASPICHSAENTRRGSLMGTETTLRLDDDEIGALVNGEMVSKSVPGLERPGWNSTIILKPIAGASDDG